MDVPLTTHARGSFDMSIRQRNPTSGEVAASMSPPVSQYGTSVGGGCAELRPANRFQWLKRVTRQRLAGRDRHTLSHVSDRLERAAPPLTEGNDVAKRASDISLRGLYLVAATAPGIRSRVPYQDCAMVRHTP